MAEIAPLLGQYLVGTGRRKRDKSAKQVRKLGTVVRNEKGWWNACLESRTHTCRLGTCKLAICPDTTQFRQWAQSLVSPGDRVVEIGASYGEASAILAQSSGNVANVIALETSKSVLAEAKRRHPDLRFIQLDVLRDPQTLDAIVTSLMANAPKARLSVYVDIGGNRELEALVAILPWILGLRARQMSITPAVVVVKSLTLFRAAINPCLGVTRLNRVNTS